MRFILFLCVLLITQTAFPQSVEARTIPFVRPVPGPVLQALAQPEQPWTPGHRGVDLGAIEGEEVRALRAGTVAFAGQVNAIGWVTLDHGGGLTTTYGPIALPTSVHKGQSVQASQVIGTIAPGGNHLDLGARVPHPKWKGKHAYLDPLRLGQIWQIRLVPDGQESP